MPRHSLFRAAARCWERAGHFDRAAERYARADAWADAGRCWALAGCPIDAAEAYVRAGEPISEARQWLASPWPERARWPYRQALEMGLSTAAEVEALLGLGEIELASDRAFAVASENGHSVEALRSLAQIAAARGRPDLAARAWGQAIAGSPAAGREVFEDWERAAFWNRSLGWGRPRAEATGWPSRAFRDVRLELVWEQTLGDTAPGNRGLAWSPDGREFAAARQGESLVLRDLMGRKARDLSLEGQAVAVAFIPESDSLLVGCDNGRVVRVNSSGAVEEMTMLYMSDDFITEIAFSPRGNRVAITSGGSAASSARLRVWSWSPQGPREILQEKTYEGESIPSCAWSPDDQTLAWCPGVYSDEVPTTNKVHLLSDAGEFRSTALHDNCILGIAASPNGRYFVTASIDRKLALCDVHTGDAVVPPWNCAQMLLTAVFHPHAALLAAGGTEDMEQGLKRPSRLYLLQFSHDPSQIKVIQEYASETGVMSVAFSPAGEHLLMGTVDRLCLFRVHLL